MIKFHYEIKRLGRGLSREERNVANGNDKAASIGAAKRIVTLKVKWTEKADWVQMTTHPIGDPSNLTKVGTYIKRSREYVAIIRVLESDV